ncbi:MAG: hypothetical protein EPN89_12135 [Methylovulum sp.]|nr:MAG: hypothetical protein EPN89_12135 [Methylovulum sp.]
MAYSLPNEVFLLLEDAFNHDRTKAQMFAKAIEDSIQAIEHQAGQEITNKKETLRSELYNELRTELATKEFVRAEINELRAEIRAEINNVKESLKAEINELRLEISTLRSELKQNSLLLKIQIGLIIFGLTLFNPAFVKLVELIMK